MIQIKKTSTNHEILMREGVVTLTKEKHTHTHTHTHIYIYIYIYIPTRRLGQDMTQGQFFKQSLTGLNSELFLLLD